MLKMKKYGGLSEKICLIIIFECVQNIQFPCPYYLDINLQCSALNNSLSFKEPWR